MEYLPETDSNGSYTNESERNVHVWCSIVKPCSSESRNKKFYQKPTLGLIAGCYIHTVGLPVAVFYSWLDIISELAPNGLICLIVLLVVANWVSIEIGSLALFRCTKDPRTAMYSLGAIPVPQEPPLPRTGGKMQEGHYMVYLYAERNRKFVPVWPGLVASVFKRRRSSPSQTCTPSQSGTPSRTPPRDTATRIAVRMRDKCCVVTGQAAVKRARGGNFTGLEVAHVYPLMAIGVQDWTTTVPESARTKVFSRQVADRPHNAILLRADVHSLFDDYQWSIWNVHTIVRFEKSGATVLDGYRTVNLRPPSLTATNPCDMDLLRSHLHVALLIHVRGVGKRAVAGFNATLL